MEGLDVSPSHCCFLYPTVQCSLGKMPASPWETSKHPPRSQHTSRHNLLTSALEKDACQGHQGPPAVLWTMRGRISAHVCTRHAVRLPVPKPAFKHARRAVRIVSAGTDLELTRPLPGRNQDKTVAWRPDSCSPTSHRRPASESEASGLGLATTSVTFFSLCLVNAYHFCIQTNKKHYLGGGCNYSKEASLLSASRKTHDGIWHLACKRMPT